MDLLSVKPSTISVDIIHPGTGKSTGLVIDVHSAQSDAVKKVVRRQNDKMLRKGFKKLTSDQVEADTMERIIAAVANWEWKEKASFGGKQLECTPENVSTVMGVDWIKNQVLEVMNDEAAFFTD